MRKEVVKFPHKSMLLDERKILDWVKKDKYTAQEFKQWFSKSVLKDLNNNPLIFYHGTNISFDRFDESKMSEMGFHFGSATAANRKTQNDNNSRIYPVIISMKRPMRLVDRGAIHGKGFDLDNIKSQITSNIIQKECKKNDKECSNKIFTHILYSINTEEEMRNYLKSKGYDGIIYKNEYEAIGGGDSVIVFDMDQVRSATDGKYLHK